nr:zonular occludens toxin domain-containing protein [uncultured Desulfobulbus sp.]
MIIGFTGTPGSGKTYEAVKKILDNIRMNRVVYTNIDGIFDPECVEMIKTYCNLSDLAFTRLLRPIESDQIEKFWMHVEPGALVILDEIHKWFSNRDWQAEKNKQFGYWASTHRHHGYDVVLITQNIERVDAAVRSLLEWNYVYRKVNFLGGAVKRSYLCYAYGGDDTNGKPLATSKRTYNPAIFRCYKSYVSKDIKELSIMRHVNVFRHPVFALIPIMLFVSLYMVFYKSSLGTGDLFGTNKVMATIEKKNKQALHHPPASSPPTATGTITPVVRNGQLVFTNRQGS